MPLFIIFVVVPVIEILLLIKVGEIIGGWYTVGLVLLSAFIGVNMLRYQGLATLMRARARMDRGEMPIGEMGDGILIAVGGALLITPGFFTDFLGFCCLVPLTRHLFVKNLARLFMQWLQKGGRAEFHYTSNDPFNKRRDSSTDAGSTKDQIIDGEYVDLDERLKPDDSDKLPPGR